MRLAVPTLGDNWDIAAIFTPSIVTGDEIPFAKFLLNAAANEFSKVNDRLTQSEMSMGVKKVTKIAGLEYRTTELISFVSNSMEVYEGPEIGFSKTVLKRTGLNADQIARILEYGNTENTPGGYISTVFRALKNNMNALWVAFYASRKSRK